MLCEKPIGLNADDARRLLQCPDNVLIAEAFMVRYHPQWLRVRDLVRSGELGEVRAVQAAFSYFNTDGSIFAIAQMPGWGDDGYRVLSNYCGAVSV